MFLRLNSPQTNAENSPSSARDLKKWFDEAESSRSSLFEEFLGEFRSLLSQAESSRDILWEQKIQRLLVIQSHRYERSLEGEKARHEQFNRADEEQQSIYRSNEDRRTNSFGCAQEIRKNTFEEAMTQQTQQNEYFISTIESLYASGRKHRMETAQRLIESSREQFHTFLSSMQEASLNAHFRRLYALENTNHVVS